MQYLLSASGQAHQLLLPGLEWVEVAIPISLYASLLHLMHTLSIIFSFCLSPPHYFTFPLSVIHLLHPRASFSCHNIYCTFLFLSTVINHDENAALESWQNKICTSSPCTARQGVQILSLLGCKQIYQGMVRLCIGKTRLCRCSVSAQVNFNTAKQSKLIRLIHQPHTVQVISA